MTGIAVVIGLECITAGLDECLSNLRFTPTGTTTQEMHICKSLHCCVRTYQNKLLTKQTKRYDWRNKYIYLTYHFLKLSCQPLDVFIINTASLQECGRRSEVEVTISPAHLTEHRLCTPAITNYHLQGYRDLSIGKLIVALEGYIVSRIQFYFLWLCKSGGLCTGYAEPTSGFWQNYSFLPSIGCIPIVKDR